MTRQITKKGFTLVEMMVAIAVFSIVMVTAMSALLNVIDANSKARAIKTAINNVSFALEGISKDMRMGTEYECSVDGNIFNKSSCGNGGVTEIRYRSPRADYDSGISKNKFAYYKFEGISIFECLQKSTRNCPTEYQPITSDEVKLTSVKFYVLNDDASTNDYIEQPKMIMAVSGKAGSKAKIETTFDLQTSVSQRVRPLSTTP
jgi:prepilin-type N-terminal cleavage/methylation domain-containing protein